jgi:hypothetical protein
MPLMCYTRRHARSQPLHFGVQDGSTPLHAACSKGLTSLVRVLLDQGADPKLSDAVGGRGCMGVWVYGCVGNVESVGFFLVFLCCVTGGLVHTRHE